MRIITLPFLNRWFHVSLLADEPGLCPAAETHRRVFDLPPGIETRLATLAERDPVQMPLLRSMVRRAGSGRHLYQLSDREIIDHIVEILESRQLILTECEGLALVSGVSEPGVPEEEPVIVPRAAAPRPAAAQEKRPAAKSETEDEPPAEKPPPPPKTAPKTWIGIELVDQKGHPVPNERYRVTLPDGTIREGQLDAQGRARFDDIDPGSCQISFPDLHATEWWAA